LRHVDRDSPARLGTFHTPHGPLSTPAFMPVGTQATVKGLTSRQIRETGATMVLANTYHLALRPGAQVVSALGGLHRLMHWDGPILTDSGGFQIFSLAERARVTEDSVIFRSHVDGSQIEFSPERVVQIQEALGSDVAMVLDHVVALPNDRQIIADATDRSVRWAARCQKAQRRKDQALFAIVQGGLDEELRAQCAKQLVSMDFAGYAVGGLSVGETPAQMDRVLEVTVPELPADRPRYLMGVGRPPDLLESIARGIDLFDCVLPTRNGRNALAFTDRGVLRLRNQKHERDESPLDESCTCQACGYSRGYIRHLFQVGEMLGPILLSIHNLTYYQRLLTEARAAIAADRFQAYREAKLAGWNERGVGGS